MEKIDTIYDGFYSNSQEIDRLETVTGVKYNFQDLFSKISHIIKEFGYRKDVPVNLHIFSRNKVDLNLFANISNGIILDGFLEVHP